MHYEVKRRFDVTRCVSVSPISKTGIKQIAHIITENSKVFLPTDADTNCTISFIYITSNSSYSFDEFDANYPSDSRYTEVSISIISRNPSLEVIFILTPRISSLSVASSVFTKVQLDDFADKMKLKIEPILKEAVPLRPTITKLETELDYMVEKTLSLPDEDGELHDTLSNEKTKCIIPPVVKKPRKDNKDIKKSPRENIVFIAEILGGIAASLVIIGWVLSIM